MIARLTLKSGRVLVLGNDRLWTCEQDPKQAEGLNLMPQYCPALSYSPSDGAPGWSHAHALQELLGGTLEFAPRPPGDPNAIY